MAMRHLKLVYVCLAVTCLVMSAYRADASGIKMNGEFSSIEISGSGCETVFGRRAYHLDFFMLETPRGAVLHFNGTSGDGDAAGFFSGINLVGHRGYDDLLLEKTITTSSGLTFKIKADGIYNSELLLLDFLVTGIEPAAGTPQCQARAELYARTRS
jgi:hypothetical protein